MHRARLSSAGRDLRPPCVASAPPCPGTLVDSTSAQDYGSRCVWFSRYGWDVQSLNPLLTTTVTSYVHNIMIRHQVPVLLSWCVSAHRTIVRFCCSVSCRSLLHTRPPVPGARACGQCLLQGDRTHCFREGASLAIPIAMLMWLLQQLQMLLLLESNSCPHVHGGNALVIAGLDRHTKVSAELVRDTGLNHNKSTWRIEESSGHSAGC